MDRVEPREDRALHLGVGAVGGFSLGRRGVEELQVSVGPMVITKAAMALPESVRAKMSE